MVRSQRLFGNGQTAIEHFDRVVVVGLGEIQQTAIVHRFARVGMVRSQFFFANGQGALGKFDSFFGVAAFIIKLR